MLIIAVAIVGLYRALARHLYLHPEKADQVGNVERAIAVENKWQAQRYGTNCLLVTEDGPVTGQEMLVRLIEEIMPDDEALGCVDELARCQIIMQLGSSADFQIRAYRDAEGGFAAVTRWIEAATLSQLPRPQVLAEAAR